MAIHVKRKTPTPAHTETRTAGEYLRKKVGVEVGDYLQAGVLVFHPNQMNAALFDDFWVDRVKSYPYWFGDQDVLNSYVKGRFARLDESWNYQVGFSWPKSPAKKDVRILHIAGLFRPWLMYLGKFYRPYHQMVMRASERYGSTDFFSGKPSAIATMTALMFGFMLLPASLKSLLKRVRQPSR
jgi:lipopolysaccharide biosynthesis glycosyltransferase